MSDVEDIFAENSSNGSDYHSIGSQQQQSEESIVIDETETEDEEDEEERAIRERMKKRQSRRMSFHPQRTSSDVSSSESEDEEQPASKREGGEVSLISDDETDEEERITEARALSPTTRLSITGVRPEDLDDDDDGDEIVMKRKVKRHVLVSSDEEDEDRDDHEASNAKGDSFEDSLQLRSFNAESSVNQGSISPKLSSTVISEDARNDSVGGRLSHSVRMSIENKLSSTAVEPVATNLSGNDSSSVIVQEKSDDILSVSSDDEQPLKSKPLVQPTIKSVLTKQKVSQKFYDDKVRELADLQKQIEKMALLTKLGKDLPDNGAGLKKASYNLEKKIAKLKNEIVNMEVHDLKGIRDEIQKSFESSIDASGRILIDSVNSSVASNNSSVQSVGSERKSSGNTQVVNISWDDIQKEADKILPKHTGKQGIATFETQKTLFLDRLSTMHKSIEGCPSEDTLAEQPKLLRIELMNHQSHALAWMLWREKQKPRGGILADDMGLGKTLSMISLILKTAELEDPDKEDEESTDEETESNNNGWKAKGRRDYYAGGTLIVCPASLMRQWEAEITNRVARNSLAVNVYHGTNRDVKPRHLAKYDVLITTYNIVSREAKHERSGIFGVNWERIILDEAHMIRNHKSAMSTACCQLKGRSRWVLTGTPIQNKEMDMYALVKFLRCTPFDDLTHWKKWIDNKTAGGMVRLQTIMKSLMLRRTKKQLHERGSLQCLPEKNIEVVQVTLGKDEMNVYQKVLLYSRTLFAQFLHQKVEKENDIYYGTQGRPTFAQSRNPNGAYDRMHQKLKQMHGREEVKQHQILVLLLRLRQICCHPGLIQQMLDDEEGNFDVSTSENDYVNEQLDLLEQLNKLKLTDTSTGGDASNDPTGPNPVLNISGNTSQDTMAMTKASSKVMLRSNPVFDLTKPSSKFTRLLELLDEKILNGDDKAVIVSQWSSVLDIVAQHLNAKRVRYVSLTGKVPVKFRNDIVTDFNKQGSGPKIMLLSLTAGGVGLNLVGANHLLLLDLHWNPQLEAQAQDRVYRVGQKKTVYVWKFVCIDTVEQAIRVLQEKKIGIANEVLTGTKQTGSKLTIDDLKSLFGY